MSRSASAGTVLPRSACRKASRPYLGLTSGWPRDREDLAYIRGPHFAKSAGVTRQRTSFVPEDGERFGERPAAIRHANNFQVISMRLQSRRNDGYAVPSLGQREQCMRRATFE